MTLIIRSIPGQIVTGSKNGPVGARVALLFLVTALAGIPLVTSPVGAGRLVLLYAAIWRCPFTGLVELGVSRLADLAGSWRRA